VGPFSDRAEDFVHLQKKTIRLMVRPADPCEDWQNQCPIELAMDEDLFEKINRRVQFTEWHKLQGVGAGPRSTLYEWHGEEWFALDPPLIEREARGAVRNWQNRVFATDGNHVLWLLERQKPRGKRRAGEAGAGKFQPEKNLASNLVALLGCM